MIDKRSGKVSYAALSFGGFLGIGDDHYPLPWELLKYDTNLGGYPSHADSAIVSPLIYWQPFAPTSPRPSLRLTGSRCVPRPSSVDHCRDVHSVASWRFACAPATYQ